MSDRRPIAGEGIEALLVRTRTQITRFVLLATVAVVAVVGVGGALAGSRALDAGLDTALLDRAARIVHEVQERLPPIDLVAPSASPSPSDDGGDDGSDDDADNQPDASPGASPELSPPEGSPDGDGDDEGESGHAPRPAVALVRFALPARPAPLAPPSIPPDAHTDEFGAGGPWAILSVDGSVVASSESAGRGFPVVALLDGAKAAPSLTTVVIGGAEFRVVTAPIFHPDDPSGPVGYVQVAGRLDVRAAQQQSLQGSLILVALLAMGGGLLVALLITRRALAPIAAAAARERAMVASASHELRTPASVILSSAEILEREGLVKPAGRDLVRGIIAESDRLGRLSADLLTLASREAAAASGGVAVHLEPLDAAAVARDAADRAAAIAGRAGAVLVTDIAKRPLRVEGDADRLVQLLLGLVENALRHGPRGGTVTIGAARDGDQAALWVDDEGPGIALGDRERVFEPFYRGSGTARTDGGAGLGLAIAREIAVSHRGTIVVESAPGGGARLIVRIPLAKGA